jgi:peptidoglycan hydrolase-like protein with peptidoglycan-binding domain
MQRDAHFTLKKLASRLRFACVSFGVMFSLAAAALHAVPPAKAKGRKLVAVHQVVTKTGARSIVPTKAQTVPQKSGKKGRAKPRSVAPSIQNHPDPERYQQIQQALAERGYFKGEATGNWGPDSVDALKQFQADKKLDTDGKITALTLNNLGLGPRHDGSTAPLSGPVAVSGTSTDTPSLNAPEATPPQ